MKLILINFYFCITELRVSSKESKYILEDKNVLTTEVSTDQSIIGATASMMSQGFMS